MTSTVVTRLAQVLSVTIALVMGVLVGIVGGDWVAVWLAPLGDLLLRLLTFLIVPIVLFTLMVGVNQSREGSRLTQTIWL